MKEKDYYRRNRDWVYEYFNIPVKERGTRYNVHHRKFKSEGGGNSRMNLVPLPREKHNWLHKAAEGCVFLKDCNNCQGIICRDIDIAHKLKTDYTARKITIENSTVDDCF